MTHAEHIVRVRTELAAVSKAFDYAVPPAWGHDVPVGTRVRVPLHGRSVRGWVVDDDIGLAGERQILPLKSWLGWGPPPAVVDLAEWAAWRWAGPSTSFLATGSPDTIVRSLPAPPRHRSAAEDAGGGVLPPWDAVLASDAAAVLRLPPATDLLDLVLGVAGHPAVLARPGSVLVLAPSAGWAARLTARLVRRGWAASTEWSEARAGWPIVVGSRAAAWAPVPELAAAVVLDAHDSSYREESTPTYSAVDVVRERAWRAKAPCLLVSPVPPVRIVAGERAPVVVEPPRTEERAGWPTVERIDRRQADPRTGLFSEEFVRLAHAVLDASDATARGPLVCVYNRTGGARLLACAHCGELARCRRCGAAEAKDGDSQSLRCPRCDEVRPLLCTHCGRLRMKTIRVGVSHLRDELAALLGVEVGEVAGPKGGGIEPEVPATPALIGTEAVLHRVRRAGAVVFLDIDLHLLAPRLSATEDTLALFVRAGRLVGGRGSGPASARVQVQTRVPDHPVLEAVALGNPVPALLGEEEIRRAAGLPPFAALALVTGSLAADYAASLEEAAGAGAGAGAGARARTGTEVAVVPLEQDRFLVRAERDEALCDLLAAVPRPAGRGLRVEVDPVSI